MTTTDPKRVGAAGKGREGRKNHTSRYKGFRPGAVSSDMSNPPDAEGHLHGITLPQHDECLWRIQCPSWCTGYTARFLSFAEAVRPQQYGLAGATVVDGWWVVEDEITGLTENHSHLQYTQGAFLAIVITDITGVADPAEPFRVLYAGLNKGA